MARLGHPVFDVIVDLLRPAPGATVVDLGCGHGPALDVLLRREPSLELLALDRSAEAVAAVHRDGTFFFCEPTVVVSATAD